MSKTKAEIVEQTLHYGTCYICLKKQAEGWIFYVQEEDTGDIVCAAVEHFHTLETAKQNAMDFVDVY